MIHRTELEMAAVRQGLFGELPPENAYSFSVKTPITEVKCGEEETESIFEEMVSEQVIFEAMFEKTVLGVEGFLGSSVFDAVGGEKLYPIYPPEAYRIGLEPIAQFRKTVEKIVDQAEPRFKGNVFLQEKVEIAEVVGPKFAVTGEVPLNRKSKGLWNPEKPEAVVLTARFVFEALYTFIGGYRGDTGKRSTPFFILARITIFSAAGKIQRSALPSSSYPLSKTVIEAEDYLPGGEKPDGMEKENYTLHYRRLSTL